MMTIDVRTRITDLTAVINSIDCFGRSTAHRLIDRFDVIQAPRLEVKHYPIHDTIKNKDLHRSLVNMAEVQWLSFVEYVRQAVMEKYKDEDLFNILTSERLLGRIKICPPHNFSEINTVIDKVRVSAYSYDDGKDGLVKVRSEMNYSIEIY